MYIKLSSLLLEGRVSDFAEKYSNLPKWMQKLIVDGDFTANKKYIDWLGKIITASEKIENRVFAEDLIRRIKVHFNKLANVDINKFKSADEFIRATDEAEKNLSNKEKLAADTELIYEDDGFLIVAPRSQDSVADFASGKTHWCITSSEKCWEDYYSENSIVLIKDREAEKPHNRYALLSSSGTNENGWTMYDSQDHTMSRPGAILSEMLPEEAIEKVLEFLDGDENSVAGRQQELEERRDQEWIEENYKDCISNLAWLISEHYHVDKEELKDEFHEYLGDEEYINMGKDLAAFSLSYFGRPDGGFLGRTLDKFLADYEGNYSDEIPDIIDYVLNVKTNKEDVLLLIKNALDDTHYNNLLKAVDFDKVIGGAINTYQKYRNSPNQMQMFDEPQTKEKFTPKNINDVVEMLTFGGYEEIASYIKTFSKQKLREHRIKLKDLIRKW